MMIVPIPEFPEEHRSKLLFGKDRIEHLQRSLSFDSSHGLSRLLDGSEFKHEPLRFDIDSEKHRTLAAYERHAGEVAYPVSVERTLSTDHLYEAYLRKRTSGSRGDTSSQTSNDSSESISETSAAEADLEALAEVFEPNDGLCKRFCMISIERLAEKEGYTHSTLDVLQESARSCTLCRTLFDSFGNRTQKWTLDRYEMTLSLLVGTDENEFPEHSATKWLRKSIYVQLFDVRPWELTECKAGRILELYEAEWEPAKLQQGEKVCIHGAHMLCYTEERDSAVDTGLPWLRKSGGYTGASGSLSVAKGWLKQCLDVESLETTHNDIDDQDARSLDGDYDSSYSTFPAERPTRLLEILQSDDPNNLRGNSVRLIETNDRDYTYAALSYCWG